MMMEHMDISFDVEELLFELEGTGASSTKPASLLARHMDMPKRKVAKLVQKARDQISRYGLLIVQNDKGGYYLMRFEEGGSSI